MSVYSGFASRSQEGSYNRSVYNLLALLQMKVIHSLKREEFDDTQLNRYFQKFYLRVAQLDDCKYLQPKFSCALKELANYYGLNEKPGLQRAPSVSSTSSGISFQQFQACNSITPVKKEPIVESPAKWESKFYFNQSSSERSHSLSREDRLTSFKKNSSGTPLLRRLDRTRAKPLPSKKETLHPRPTINNNNIVITINRSYNMDNRKKIARSANRRHIRQLSNMENIYTSPGLKQRPRRLWEVRAARPDNGIRTMQSTYNTKIEKKCDIESLLNPNDTSGCSDLEVIHEGINESREMGINRKRHPSNVYRKFVPIIRR